MPTKTANQPPILVNVHVYTSAAADGSVRAIVQQPGQVPAGVPAERPAPQMQTGPTSTGASVYEPAVRPAAAPTAAASVNPTEPPVAPAPAAPVTGRFGAMVKKFQKIISSVFGPARAFGARNKFVGKVLGGTGMLAGVAMSAYGGAIVASHFAPAMVRTALHMFGLNGGVLGPASAWMMGAVLWAPLGIALISQATAMMRAAGQKSAAPAATGAADQ